MLRRFYFTVTIFLSGMAFPQNKTGLGIAEVKFENLPLYKKTGNNILPSDTIFVGFDGRKRIFKSKIELKPYALEAGGCTFCTFATLQFRVLSEDGNFYEVLTNENNWQSFYIKKSAAQTYSTWENWLKNAVYITKPDIKIYNRPNGKIIASNFNNNDLHFKVVEVSGDWIKVTKWRSSYTRMYEGKKYEGWTKWINDGRLSIRIIDYIVE